MSCSRILFLVVLSTFMCSARANAQEDNDGLKIAVYPQVRATIDSETEAGEDARRIPGGADVVSQSAWKDRRAQTVKDILDFTPGAYTQPRNGAESQRLSIRGSGLARFFQGRGLLVMQDGIPINTADGTFEFPVIDPWLIRYAQVYKGANALEYGASNLGGAINFITPNGVTDTNAGFRLEGGSFGTLHGLIGQGWRWEDKDAFAAATSFMQDGFRDNNRQETGRFSGNFGWTSEDTEQRFYLSQTGNRVEIPGAISKAEIDRDPSAANPANVAGHYQRNLDVTRLGHRMAWSEGQDRIETTLYYTRRYLDNPVTTYIRENSDDLGARLKYSRDIGLDRLTAGFNAAYGLQDEKRFANAGGQAGAHILNRDLDALTTEAYLQYERHLKGQLYAIASAQGIFDERNIEQKFPTAAEQDRNYRGINPRAGLRYDLSAEAQLFSNLSRSTEPPALDELSGSNAPGFHDLQAQRATTFETGWRGRFHGMHAEAAFYRSWLKGEFVNYKFPNGDTATINAGRSVHDGIELGLSGQAIKSIFKDGDAVSMNAAYTGSFFRLEGDPVYGDNRLPGMPPHYLRAEVTYRHPTGWSFGPDMEWVPAAYPVDLTHSLHADAYIIFGLRAAWDASEKASLYAEARNIADRHYIATTNVVPDAGGQDGRYFYPGDRRSVFGGMKLKF
jgi:iron complex outermembrane receptor protein